MKSTRYYSNRQEKQVAKKLGGKKVANSGATAFHKGDVCTKDFLIECKTAIAEKKSMSIKKEWLDKLKEEAFSMGKPYYALAFNFGQILENESNFYIINERLFKLLQTKLEGES